MTCYVKPSSTVNTLTLRRINFKYCNSYLSILLNYHLISDFFVLFTWAEVTDQFHRLRHHLQCVWILSLYTASLAIINSLKSRDVNHSTRSLLRGSHSSIILSVGLSFRLTHICATFV